MRATKHNVNKLAKQVSELSKDVSVLYHRLERVGDTLVQMAEVIAELNNKINSK